MVTRRRYLSRMAIAGMLAGKIVSINGGFALVDPPAAEAAATPEPQPNTLYSTLDYLSKFSDTEYQAVRSGSMALQRGLDSLIAAQYVNVTDPRVTQYLDAMQTAGIIDAARKAELLTPEAS